MYGLSGVANGRWVHSGVNYSGVKSVGVSWWIQGTSCSLIVGQLPAEVILILSLLRVLSPDPPSIVPHCQVGSGSVLPSPRLPAAAAAAARPQGGPLPLIPRFPSPRGGAPPGASRHPPASHPAAAALLVLAPCRPPCRHHGARLSLSCGASIMSPEEASPKSIAL